MMRRDGTQNSMLLEAAEAEGTSSVSKSITSISSVSNFEKKSVGASFTGAFVK